VKRIGLYTKTAFPVGIVFVLAIMGGCGGGSETAVRFRMERMLVQADRLREEMKLKGPLLSDDDLAKLVEAYAAISRQAVSPGNAETIAKASEEKKQAWALASLAMTRIGNLYLEGKMYDKAYEYFKNVAENSTTTPIQRNAVMAYMALAMEKLGHYSAAAGLYDTLAQEYIAVVVPENPNLDALEAPLKAAQMWLQSGDAGKRDRELQRAREYYREIAGKYKGTLTGSAAMAKLAASYLQENRYGEATDILRSIRDDSSGFVSPGVLMSIADIYMNRANDLPNAERTYRDYIRYYPQQGNVQSAYLGLGLSLYGQGKYEEARKSVQGMEKLPKIGQENLAQSYFLTALCYEKEDKWELARGQFDIVQTSFMGTDQGFEAALHVVDHYRQHGQTGLAEGAFNDAVNYINKYVAQNSANPVAVSRGLGYLVRAYTENGEMANAAEQLSLLHQRYPQQPEGKFAPLRLSEIYANSLYDTSKAIFWLKLFVNENPDAPDLGEIKSQIETLEKPSGK